MNAIAQRLTIPVVFSVALAVRLIWWALAYGLGDYGFTTYDSEQYLRLAENLRLYGVFSQSVSAPFYPDVVRTPGYPVWLAFWGWLELPIAGIALVQSVLGALVPVVAMRTARALGFLGCGWMGLLLAVDAGLAVFAPLMLTDALFTLLVAVWMHLLLTATSRPNWLATAALAGALVLIRPSGLFIPLATLAWALVRLGVKPISLGVAVVAMALPFGWMVRNYSEQNSFILSTIGPNTLYLFHAAAVKAQAEKRSFQSVQSEMINELNMRFDWGNDPEAISDFTTYCKHASMDVYRAYPAAAAKVTVMNLTSFIAKPPRGYFDVALGLGKSNTPVTGFQADRSQGLLQRLMATTSATTMAFSGYQFALQLLQTLLFILGLRILWIRHKPLALLVMAVFGYFWFTSAITETDARFRLPVLPIMALCWAVALEKRNEAWVANEKL